MRAVIEPAGSGPPKVWARLVVLVVVLAATVVATAVGGDKAGVAVIIGSVALVPVLATIDR